MDEHVRAYQHMLDVGSRVMHAYCGVMLEAANHAENHRIFILLVRQAFGCLRRMLKAEGHTLSDIRVTVDTLREGGRNVRQNFERRMRDPEWDACFNPKRYRKPV